MLYLQQVWGDFMLTGSRILVTGGTGSFGHKFVQMTVESHNPEQIINIY